MATDRDAGSGPPPAPGETGAEPILRLDGVVAGYGRLTVLNGTSLTVRAGAITTLIGPNGAGKSTVFKAIFGLVRVTAGSIHFQDADITGAKPRDLLAQGIVYVPQGRNLFPELSVRHNLEMGGVTLPDQRRLAERVEGVLDRFPMLREKADRQASTLSGGEQKLLELGRGLLLDPKLVLIDEPSIGLAPLVVRRVFDELTQLRDHGVTVLMVEQNARSALAVSDDALVLEQGRLALSGPAADILDDPRIGELFLGGGLVAGQEGRAGEGGS